ncbi:hypothetical protein T484DRAFT_1909870 [Baffinella frigidus]|nr:hypothetical protein T484DRAFT_1909870 [Cryptophyta sp. CCMP2293]
MRLSCVTQSRLSSALKTTTTVAQALVAPGGGRKAPVWWSPAACLALCAPFSAAWRGAPGTLSLDGGASGSRGLTGSGEGSRTGADAQQRGGGGQAPAGLRGAPSAGGRGNRGVETGRGGGRGGSRANNFRADFDEGNVFHLGTKIKECSDAVGLLAVVRCWTTSNP